MFKAMANFASAKPCSPFKEHAMKSAQNIMKPGDVSLGLAHHFAGAFGRAGGTAEMLQQAADNRSVMQQIVELLRPTTDDANPRFTTSFFFHTRPGLWVSDDFTSRITLAYPNLIVRRGLVGIESFDLTNNLLDKTILARSEMGGEENVRKHAFTPDQICDLMTLQPEGSAGKLLTNGFANLFYVVGKDEVLFVLFVGWDADNRRWRVVAWKLGENGIWHAGCRVFRNTQV